MGSINGEPPLPQRAKFSWDMVAVPWTDGEGNLDEYALAVSSWKQFHDALPMAHSNKIPANVQGIILRGNLYGRAWDMAKGIPSKVISGADGARAIVKAVYPRYALEVVSEVFEDFIKLLAVVQGEGESFESYKSRFAANSARFNGHSTDFELPEALLLFLLLANSKLSTGSRIRMLASAVSEEVPIDETLTTAAYLKAIKYTF